MKPTFTDIKDLKEFGAAPACSKDAAQELWHTPENIDVKSLYTAKDLEGMEHLNYAAGIAPYLRGPYSTMYVMLLTSCDKAFRHGETVFSGGISDRN